MPISFVTLAIPFDAHHLEDAEKALDSIGNPLRPDLQAKLDSVGVVHFLSMNAVPAEKPGASAHLVFEMTVDDFVDWAVGRWAAALAPDLEVLLAAARVDRGADSVARFICRPGHRVQVGTGWFENPGLTFTGSPGMSVARILDEAEMAERAMTLVAGEGRRRTALETLRSVRGQMKSDGRFTHLMKAEPAPFLHGQRRTVASAVPTLLQAALTGILWPATLVVGIGSLITLVWGARSAADDGASVFAAGLAGITSVFWFLLASAVLLAAVGAALYSALRRKEQADLPDDTAPDPKLVQAIAERENVVIKSGPSAADDSRTKPRGELRDADVRIAGMAVAQNHLFAVSAMKPGPLRRLTLRLGFWVIEALATYVFRPGFLGEIGTIHAARWVMLPKTGQLLFFSNYGGSWESYLEDFITKAHAGLTAAWSNTIGYPRTANLFLEGATDGDRFKRWARRQQRPTRAWYSAYPHLNTGRIRVNAAIRQGLAGANTESEALDWLTCFNSAPMMAKLDPADIQALAYSGMSKLPSARAVVLEMSDAPAKNRQWLAEIEAVVTTAEKVPESEARVIGLSAAGLEKLGLSEAVRQSFPAAFQHGMDADWRARILGDIGDDAPSCWNWGNSDKPAHAILLLYAKSTDAAQAMAATEKARAERYGLQQNAIIQLKDRAGGKQAVGGTGTASASFTPGGKFENEPFGFADGISQPIIKGTPRALSMTAETDHLVEAGEFILGYADNRGYVPPSPRVPSGEDSSNLLTAIAADPHRQRPDFSELESNLPRDLGRNGSFLVVRQLQQHVEELDRFLNDTAAKLPPEQKAWIDLPQGRTLQDWIGAKMIGRWGDGGSMARHATTAKAAGGRQVLPDNRFRFGEDDPSGFGCPLGAHVRRANPRESFAPGSADQMAITNRHRILRAGRAYGAGTEEKGLLFICLNADIERQFEFIQQSWCLATQFHGLDNEADPILGRRLKSTHFTIPTPKGPICIDGLPKFITVRGGGYFFMPSRRALQWMAQARSAEAAEPVTVAQGCAA